MLPQRGSSPPFGTSTSHKATRVKVESNKLLRLLRRHLLGRGLLHHRLFSRSRLRSRFLHHRLFDRGFLCYYFFSRSFLCCRHYLISPPSILTLKAVRLFFRFCIGNIVLCFMFIFFKAVWVEPPARLVGAEMYWKKCALMLLKNKIVRSY